MTTTIETISIQNKVLGLIYEKTGMIFIKPDFGKHFLVPDNLRELSNFVSFLGDMAESNEPSNFRKFKDYFINIWIKNNLAQDKIRIINEFLATDLQRRNKYIVLSLYEYYKDYQFSNPQLIRGEIPKEIDYIFAKENVPANVSLGDVLYFLNLIDLYSIGRSDKYLIFSIKTLYSMEIYENLVIENKYNEVANLMNGLPNNHHDKKLIRGERHNFQVNNYRELKIGERKLGDIVKTSEIKKMTKHEQDLIEWLHYFLISVGKLEPKYRTEKKEISYERRTNFGVSAPSVKNAQFDVLAFLFHSIIPVNNYIRIFAGFDTEDSNISSLAAGSTFREVEAWRNAHYSALPIYSIEFFEKILRNVSYDYKGAADSFYDLVRFLFQQLHWGIATVRDENDFIDFVAVNTAFEECPIIKPIFEIGVKNEDSDYAKLLNQLVLIKDPEENEDEEPKKEMISKIRNKLKLKLFLGQQISKFEEEVSNKRISGLSIKLYLGRLAGKSGLKKYKDSAHEEVKQLITYINVYKDRLKLDRKRMYEIKDVKIFMIPIVAKLKETLKQLT